MRDPLTIAYSCSILYIAAVKEQPFPCTRSAGSSTLAPAVFLLASALLFGAPLRASTGEASLRSVQGSRTVTSQDVPEAAREVFEYVIKNGRAPAGYVGGRLWQNREHRLPRGAQYREYDIHPKERGVNRGAERIIVDRVSGKGWYTGDHYRSFVRIERR